jgi:peptide/nickel transport system substrate-binding protein
VPVVTRLTRRSFVAGAAAAAGALAAGGTLSGCGSSDGPDRGRLRVGAAGLPTGTSLDPRKASPGAAFLAQFHLYDGLMRLEGGRAVRRLAESVEPNAGATRWTVRLRPDATFHDGRPVRAADVLASLRTIADPRTRPLFASAYADVDVAGSRVRDDRTVELTLRRPRGDLADSVLALGSPVFPAGTTDFAAAIGSGPYRLESADPGSGVRLRAFGDHWDGAPRIDMLEIRTITDPVARLNGVRGGQLDYAVGVSATGARTVAGDGGVEIRRGGVGSADALVVAMNERDPRFADPRVREALRLAVDRGALVDRALLGQGTVGNDLVGLGLPGYAADLPQRGRDVERARGLLAAAGVRRLTLRAADLVPGLLDTGRLVAAQLREAGVRVDVQAAQAASYFQDVRAVSRTPFQAFYFANRPAAVHLSSVIGPRAQWNLVGYGGAYADRLRVAQETPDDARRAARFVDLQHDLHAHGGEVVWGFREALDAARPGVTGVARSQSVPLFSHARIA